MLQLPVPKRRVVKSEGEKAVDVSLKFIKKTGILYVPVGAVKDAISAREEIGMTDEI